MPAKKKVKKFTRSECNRVEGEFRTKIEDVARQLGLNVQLGPGRFNATEFRLPMTLTLGENAQTEMNDNRKAEFEDNAEALGLKPEHFGQEFNLGDGSYKIIGCKPRATKNTVLVEKTKTRTGQRAKPGQRYVVPHQEIQRALGEVVSVGNYDIVE